jgi:hypothetical protein
VRTEAMTWPPRVGVEGLPFVAGWGDPPQAARTAPASRGSKARTRRTCLLKN